VELFLRLHKDVISKDTCHAAEIGHSLEALRAKLATLREFPANSVA
jgi:hypothetical protein